MPKLNLSMDIRLVELKIVYDSVKGVSHTEVTLTVVDNTESMGATITYVLPPEGPINVSEFVNKVLEHITKEDTFTNTSEFPDMTKEGEYLINDEVL